MQKLLETGGMDISQVDWFVPHSANMRMLQLICKELKFSIDKTLVSAEEFGNTSAASIPLAVWRGGIQTGKIKQGETLALYGFGAGQLPPHTQKVKNRLKAEFIRDMAAELLYLLRVRNDRKCPVAEIHCSRMVP